MDKYLRDRESSSSIKGTNNDNTIIIDTEIKFNTTQTTLTYLSVLGHSVLNR